MAGFSMPSPALLQNAAPRTPGRKRRASNIDVDMDGDAVSSPTPTKRAKTTPTRRRKSPGRVATNRAIPRSYEECTNEDKMMIDMRKDGKTWAEIQEAWKDATGQKVAASTLPNRFTRLKANFIQVELSDQAKLLEAKRHIEAKFMKEKWGLIAKEVEYRGGAEYKPDDLRREWSKLVAAKAPAGPPAGIEYADFDKTVLDDGGEAEEGEEE